MSLILYKGNRLETLVEHLAADVLKSPLSSPFKTEPVIVQTQGMAQWLKLELSRRLGIAANIEFAFPRAFLLHLMEDHLPDTSRPIEPGALSWRVMETLETLLDQPAFSGLKHYLSTSADPRRLFQLAERIAILFDQYSVYRPELIEAWLQAREHHWQAILWRTAMTDGLACQGKYLFDLLTVLQSSTCDRIRLPERLSLFGATSLPPMYLKVFEALSRYIPVHLFWLSPCREYWGDKTSSQEARRIQAATGDGQFAAGDLHLDAGHPLLVSWGKTGRDFLNLILETNPAHEVEDYEDPGTGTLLRFIQSGILNLEDEAALDAAQSSRSQTERGVHAASPASGQGGLENIRTSERTEVEAGLSPRSEPSSRPAMILADSNIVSLIPIRKDDRSVQVHSCHSPLRELQVLRDHLLGWLAADPTLSPQDILIMLPEVEAYAPFVKGVFEATEPGVPAIPYTLADRGARRQSALVDGFVELLRLPGSRLTSPAVLALFQTVAVRQRFGVAEEELPQIRQWIQNAGICWGRNADHRAELGLPPFGEHSWEHGRDRLLLGYAMADGGDALVNELLPCEGIEGTSTELLGRWLDFQQQLFAVLEQLSQARTLIGWANTLNQAFDTLFLPVPAEEMDANMIRQVLDELRQQQAASRFTHALPLAVILERILPRFEETPSGKAFLRGQVTFAGLSPLRSVPFRVICVLGMHDGAFPRRPASLAFDLMAKTPKIGDASRRQDDRYLFLETLLSARDCLYISYVGQSVRDNSPSPPSVVVSELLDYLAARCRFEGFTEEPAVNASEPPLISQLLLTRHRLHPFSPAYFQPDSSQRFFSFSPAHAAISQSLADRARQPLPASFLSQPIEAPGEEWKTVALSSLQSYFRNPSKYFVTKRLEFTLPEDEDPISEEEPFSLERLAKFGCRVEALESLLNQAPEAQLLRLWKGKGRLPPGAAGWVLGRDVFDETRPMLKEIRRVVGQANRSLKRVRFDLGSFKLEGELPVFEGVGLVYYRPSKVDMKEKPNAHLDLWLAHLALQLSDWPGPRRSCLIGEDHTYWLKEVDSADERLKTLLSRFWQGLSQPLRFFPKSSFAYAIGPGKRTSKTPEELAWEAWEGNEDYLAQEGEKRDPYFSLCFKNDPDPLNSQFQALALEIVNPLLDHQDD